MKLLLTGSSGWLGRHLAPRLRARGETVTGLDVAPGPETQVIGSVADRALVAGARKHDAAAVITRLFPDVRELYARRGWTLPESIDRVYDAGLAEREPGFRARMTIKGCRRFKPSRRPGRVPGPTGRHHLRPGGAPRGGCRNKSGMTIRQELGLISRAGQAALRAPSRPRPEP